LTEATFLLDKAKNAGITSYGEYL